MTKKVKGLILRPGEYLEEIEIEDSLQGMYDAIGCDLIEVPVIGTDKEGNQWQMILDEEGKINGKQFFNTTLTPFGIVGDIAVGPMLFLGLDDEGGNCDLTEASADEIHKRLWNRSPRDFEEYELDELDEFLDDKNNKSSFTVNNFGKEK